MNVDSFKATAEQVVSQTAELTLSKVSTKARAGSRHASAAVARVQGKGSLGDCGGPRHWVGQGAWDVQSGTGRKQERAETTLRVAKKGLCSRHLSSWPLGAAREQGMAG